MSAINMTLFRFVLGLTHKVVEGIEEEQMRTQPAAGINPPIWILGHLAVVLDMGLATAGLTPICPAAWGKAFGPNSRLDSIPHGIATKAQIMQKISEAGELLLAKVPQMTEAELAKLRPGQLFEKELPSVRDLLENLMFTHHMLHVGQLTVWRRLMNLPSVINIKM
jgi:hypothetical protein